MSDKPWTLSQELCKITNSDTLGQALFKLNLIDSATTAFGVREDPDWVRGGAETYIFRFWITVGDVEQGYIIKACVTLTDIEQTLGEWVRRRTLLEAEGLCVPRLFFAGGGIIIEELLPFTLSEVLAVSDLHNTSAILGKLTELVAVLVKLGFSPIDAIIDLRSHGADVVLVDFGEDLGPPYVSREVSERLFVTMLKKVRSWGVEVSQERAYKLKQYFFQIVKPEVS